jgi:hypothetical protein
MGSFHFVAFLLKRDGSGAGAPDGLQPGAGPVGAGEDLGERLVIQGPDPAAALRSIEREGLHVGLTVA